MHSRRESDTGPDPPADADDPFHGLTAFDVVDGELMPRVDGAAASPSPSSPRSRE